MDTYTTLRDKYIAQYKSRGIPEDRAILMAQKMASKKVKQANPGRSQVIRRKVREEFIEEFITEVHGITGLIASPPASTSTGGLAPAGTASGSNTKVGAEKADDKDLVKSGKTASPPNSFDKKGTRKMSVERAKPGSVSKSPDTMESIESEFGIK